MLRAESQRLRLPHSRCRGRIESSKVPLNICSPLCERSTHAFRRRRCLNQRASRTQIKPGNSMKSANQAGVRRGEFRLGSTGFRASGGGSRSKHRGLEWPGCRTWVEAFGGKRGGPRRVASILLLRLRPVKPRVLVGPHPIRMRREVERVGPRWLIRPLGRRGHFFGETQPKKKRG